MRTLLAVAVLLLSLLAPTPALAGDCPASLPTGVVERERYQLGDTIEFFGNFTDFADPGTVTITLTPSGGGQPKVFEAFRSPDGAWYLFLELEGSEFLGRWSVTVVVEQTSSTDTCTDAFEVRGPRPPGTDVAAGPGMGGSVVAALALAVPLPVSFAAVAGLLVGFLCFRGSERRIHDRRA